MLRCDWLRFYPRQGTIYSDWSAEQDFVFHCFVGNVSVRIFTAYKCCCGSLRPHWHFYEVHWLMLHAPR